MLRFLGRRLLQVVPVLILVTFFTTALSELLPASPAYAIYGSGITPQFIAKFNVTFGLNHPILVQYWNWVKHAFSGNLGISYETRQTVTSQLAARLPATVELAVIALVVALIIAIPVAMLAGARQGGIFDRVSTGIASVANSTPAFVSGILLSYLLAVKARWFPTSGWSSLSAGLGVNIKFVVLPVITLVLVITPNFMRILRGDVVSILNSNYIEAARSRGLPEWYVMFRHVLRPASASLITVAGLSFGALLGGAIVVEVLFEVPGIGLLAEQAVYNKDIPILQGIVVCVAIFFVIINGVVDLSYGLLDPRVRQERR